MPDRGRAWRRPRRPSDRASSGGRWPSSTQAIAEAGRRGLRISAAIVDERGDPIQQDRMDGAPAASVNVAQHTAATAAVFACPSEEVVVRFPGAGVLDRLASGLPFAILPAPGGLPIEESGRVVAGIGVGGPPPEICADLATAGAGRRRVVTERVCIVGCGAIGGLYAAHLATLPEVEVWAYDVAADHVRAINEHGLRLVGHEDLTAPVKARTDAAEIPACRFGIVATKGTATAPAIAATAQLFGDGAVCSVQNGIGNEEVVAERVRRVMRGVTLPAGRLAAPGVIHVDALGPTWIGPFEPSPARAPEIARLGELLNRAGMATHVLSDARGAQWTKLLFNASTNPLCALTGLTHGQLCAHPPTRRVVGQLLREGLEVAAALGVALDADPEAMVDEAARANPHHRPSMLEDVLAHRRTEIDTLNGGIIRAGEAAGVTTPLNAAVAGLVSGLERSWSA